MPWCKKTATDFKDCLSQIIDFATKAFEAGAATPGSNAGDGIVYGQSASENSVVETWTLECTTGGDLIFTGTTAPGTADTYVQTGTNDGKPTYTTATRAVWWSTANTRWYNTTLAEIGTPPVTAGFELVTASNIGTWTAIGTSTGSPISAASTDGSDGSAVFSVTGSVSGVKATATCGAPYSIAEFSFILLSGTVDFMAGDTFTVGVVASTALWSVNDSDLVSSQQYVLLQGVGGGSDEIFVGFRTQSDAAAYFNMEVSGFTGYVGTSTYDAQPGKGSMYACMSNVSFEFYMFMTGRSIKVVPVIGTVYEHMYAGWFLPNATVSQYGYPLFIGGSTDDLNQLVGGTEDDHTSYWAGFSDEYSSLLYNGVAYVEINEFNPKNYGNFSSLVSALDGARVTYPATLLQTATDTVFGDLEGVEYVTNGDSALTVEDVINAQDTGYIIFQDVFRTGTTNVAAFDLIGDA